MIILHFPSDGWGTASWEDREVWIDPGSIESIGPSLGYNDSGAKVCESGSLVVGRSGHEYRVVESVQKIAYKMGRIDEC